MTSETTACPFCEVASGRESEYTRRGDVVWRDAATTAFVSPRWWPNNAGNVLVVPNEHVENLYEASDETLGAVYATAKRIASAMKSSYPCDGTSTRQHNDAGAGQEVFHLHVHVFPRYAGDELYARDAEYRWNSRDERAPYAELLREALR
jgi:histidine triad (HIT) family protein